LRRKAFELREVKEKGNHTTSTMSKEPGPRMAKGSIWGLGEFTQGPPSSICLGLGERKASEIPSSVPTGKDQQIDKIRLVDAEASIYGGRRRKQKHTESKKNTNRTTISLRQSGSSTRLQYQKEFKKELGKRRRNPSKDQR